MPSDSERIARAMMYAPAYGGNMNQATERANIDFEEKDQYPMFQGFLTDLEIPSHAADKENVRDSAIRYNAIQDGKDIRDVYWRHTDNAAQYPEERARKRYDQDVKVLMHAMIAGQARQVLIDKK